MPQKGDVLEMLQNELGTCIYVWTQSCRCRPFCITNVCVCVCVCVHAGIDTVSFSDWESIDKHEISEGEKEGKPREKVVDFDKMMDIVHINR